MPWDELGHGIFRRRYARFDQNIGVVVTEDGLVVIDTRSSHVDADEVLSELRELSPLPVVWVVNTHYHWDHTFGNARFTGATIVGHDRCRDALVSSGEAMRARVMANPSLPDDLRRDFAGVVITPPVVTFTEDLALHIGGRRLALDFHGPGHTDSDVVITVDDVCFAGDLVEEGAPPSFGDSFPRGWVEALDRLTPRLPLTVVPGHGDIVDPDFVRAQREEMATAIASINEGVGSGLYPRETMATIAYRLQVLVPST